MNAIFESLIDEESCTGCGICEERCPVDAISLERIAKVNRDLCLGCGLCVSTCPESAISTVPREDGIEPFNRVLEMGMAILEGKRNKAKKFGKKKDCL
jgi:ferredoxin